MTETVQEQALVMECQGERLVGILHAPKAARNTAVVMMPAGQLQYRAGCGRQLVEFARAFAERGFPAMRFDARGAGDSSGSYQGFEFMGDELEVVIATLKSHVPEVERVVLWGGCEAASGIMIHSPRLPEVSGWILSNPFIKSQQVKALAERRRYWRRLRDKAFWVKLFTLQYNLLDYAGAFASRVFAKLVKPFRKQEPARASAKNDSARDFMQRMLAGAQQFRGSALMVMSGSSMVRAEFDLLLEQAPPWQAAFGNIPSQRVDIPDADQTFSTRPARRAFLAAALEWVEVHANQG